MLIEQSAYASPWRGIAPEAKGLFALAGLAAAFAGATRPLASLAVTALVLAVTFVGARVSPLLYLRVAAPPLFFLAISGLTLAYSVTPADHAWSLAATGTAQAQAVTLRSLGALAALLFLVLTTPLTDLVALARRLRTPELLLDLMVLGYRSLFVLSQSIADMRTAQAARLGYAGHRRSLRSLGQLVANLTLQVWDRSHGLHQAALARNGDGPLRFLAPDHANRQQHTALAGLAGLGLLAMGLFLP